MQLLRLWQPLPVAGMTGASANLCVSAVPAQVIFCVGLTAGILLFEL